MAAPPDGAGFAQPDPRVTGNVYCAGMLDEVLLGVAVPLRDRLRELAGGEIVDLWCVRYSRGGEHLKVRIHAPAELEAPCAEALESTAGHFLGSIGPADEASPPARSQAPPIDVEDSDPAGARDRSFRFTTYRRSGVSLGGEPLLSDDAFCARITTCLARACDQLLDALAEHGEVLRHSQRQRLLFRALLTGLGGLGLSAAEAASYLAYHRDWLIRFPVLRQGGSQELADGWLADLGRQASSAGATVEALEAAAAPLWAEAGARQGAEPASQPWLHWGTALAELRDYVSSLPKETSALLDPFAPAPWSNPVFKVLHGLANHLGLRARDESFAYELLLRAVARDLEPYRSLRLTPL